MIFRLRNEWSLHLPEVLTDGGTRVEACLWRPGGALPSWTSYMVDPVSCPGRLMIIGPYGAESIAHDGDFLVLHESKSGLIAVDPDLFLTRYKEVQE